MVVDGRQCEGGLHLPVTSARHVAGPASARPSTRLTGRQGPRQVRVSLGVRVCVRGLLRLPANLDSQLRGSAFARISSTSHERRLQHTTVHDTPPPPAHTLHLPSCHPVNSPTTALSLAREKKPHQSLLPTSQPPSQPASSACKLGPTIALACPCARSLLPPAPTVTSLAPYHNIALPCRAFPARHSKRGRLSATATWLPSPLACPPLALAPRRIS